MLSYFINVRLCNLNGEAAVVYYVFCLFRTVKRTGCVCVCVCVCVIL